MFFQWSLKEKKRCIVYCDCSYTAQSSNNSQDSLIALELKIYLHYNGDIIKLHF